MQVVDVLHDLLLLTPKKFLELHSSHAFTDAAIFLHEFSQHMSSHDDFLHVHVHCISCTSRISVSITALVGHRKAGLG